MKKKNGGFTVIELLAALVIVGILTAIAIVVINNLKSKQRETYNMTQNAIFVETAKLFFEEHKDMLPQTLYSSEYITLEELYAGNYLTESFTDYDKNKFSGLSRVKVTKIGKNKYVYSGQLLSEDGEVIVETPNNDSVITFTIKNDNANKVSNKYYINSSPKIEVSMSDADILKGYTYQIYKDDKLYKSSDIVTIDATINYTTTFNLNTNQFIDGEYKIKVTTNDINGNKKSATSNVIVIDTTKPKCSVDLTGTLGENEWYKSKVNLELKITEKNTAGLSKGITTSSTVSYNGKTTDEQSDTNGQPWYGYVKDAAGNTGSCTKTVKVDTEKPSCTFSNIKVPSVTTSDIVSGKQGTIDLTCTDSTSLINNYVIGLGTSNIVTTSNVAKIVSVSSPTTLAKGYKYTITFEGVSYGTFKVKLNSDSLKDNAGNKSIEVSSSNITSYNKADIPTNSLCVARTYTGSSQQLTSATLGTGYTLSGYNQTNAGEHTITATLTSGYRWSDNNGGTKTFKCSMAKATPVIELSASSGSASTGGSVKFTATVKSGSVASSAGTLTVASGNETYATVSPTSKSITATTTGVGTEETVSAKSSNGTSASSTTIKVNFTPSDTTNFTSAVQKTYTMTVNPYTRTATFNVNGNGTSALSTPSGCSKNSSTGAITCSCKSSGTSTSCNITTPTITAPSATPSVCGYTTSTTGVRTGCTSHNTSITLSSNPTYYAQTYNSTALSGTFTIQDSNAATQSGGSTSCYRYNGNSNCTITAPKLTNKTGYTVVGWKKDGTTSSTSSDLAATGSATVSISSNVTYKSVTYKSYSASFSIVDTAAATTSATSASCNAYNGATSCSVTAPTLTNKSGYTAVGWSATNGGTTKVTSFTSGNTYYSITYNNTALSGTFTIQDSAAATQNGGSTSCYRYNGNSNCTITAPKLTNKTGYTVVGWKKDGTTSSTTSDLASTGSATVSISGNVTYKSVTYYNTALIGTFFKNGAASQTTSDGVASTDEEVTRSCYKYNGSSSCNITTPKIVAASGFEVIGYGTNFLGTTSSVNHNTTISISKNVAYAAITKSTNQITIHFMRNGATSQTPDGGSASTSDKVDQKCYRYNGVNGCIITSPTITRSGFTIIGYGTSANSTESSWDAGTEEFVSSDATYYAITKYNVVLVFYANNNTLKLSSNTATGTNTLTNSCTLYNTATTCTMATPTITGSTNTPNVVGFKNTSTMTSNAGFDSNSTITVDKDGYQYNSGGGKTKTWYAITMSSTSTYTANWNANGATLSSTTQSKCTTALTYNGESPPTSCTVTAPKITRTDYTIIGFNTSSSSTSSILASQGTLTLTSSNTGNTWYAITKYNVVLVFYANNNTIKLSSNTATGTNTLTNSCTLYNTATTCTMATPTITGSTNTPNVVGFKNTSTMTSNAGFDSNSTITVDKDGYQYNSGGGKTKTWYAITMSSTSTYTANWNANGATLSSTTQSKCTTALTYNGESPPTSCTVTAPKIKRTDYTIVGYNTSASSTTSTLANQGTLTLTNSNTGNTWYAITYIDLSASFTKGGNVDKIDSTLLSCSVWNTANICRITLPSITPTSGYTEKGWEYSTSSSTYYYSSGTSIKLSTEYSNISSLQFVSGKTFTAVARKYTATEVEYDDSYATIGLCTDFQCAIDSLAGYIN